MGAGLEVTVRRGSLVATPLTPVPGLRTAMRLHPDDPTDPGVYRIVFPRWGKSFRAVFTRETPPRLLLDVMSFEKQPDWQSPRRWMQGLAVAGAAATAARLRRRS